MNPHLPRRRRAPAFGLILVPLIAVLAACERPAEPATGLIARRAEASPPAAPPVAPAASPPTPAAAPTWRGRFRATLRARSGGDLEFVVDGDATFRPDPAAPDRYVIEGVQTLSTVWIHCSATVAPAEHAMPPGTLRIDTTTSPARYTLEAGAVWDAVVHGRCPNGAASIPMRVPGRLEVGGTVGADGRLTGALDHGELRWEWDFQRLPAS